MSDKWDALRYYTNIIKLCIYKRFIFEQHG